jgi:hypothetical protein
LLAEHCSGGEYVLSSARLVGDEEDHSIWRQSQRAWVAAATDALFAHFPAEQLDVSLREPVLGSGWKGQYEAELRTVRDGLKLLESLSERIQTSSLVGDPEGH